MPDILLFKELAKTKGIELGDTIDEIVKGVVENVRKNEEDKPED